MHNPEPLDDEGHVFESKNGDNSDERHFPITDDGDDEEEDTSTKPESTFAAESAVVLEER